MRMTNKTMAIIGALVAVAALSSTGTAVAGDLITTKQIKDNAITTDKVKNGTLVLKDFKASERAKLVGPAGPAGPGGLPGLPGAIGPTGPSVAASSVIVQSPVITVRARDTGVVVASCPAGKKVTGGGYFSSIAIAASSSPGTSGTTWGAVINNIDNVIPVDAWAYAVCA